MKRMLLSLAEEPYNVHYLENECVCVMGVHIWGTPWTPQYGGWAFNYEPEGEFCRDLYSKIPEDIGVCVCVCVCV
jgi:hypothetical protein